MIYKECDECGEIYDQKGMADADKLPPKWEMVRNRYLMCGKCTDKLVGRLRQKMQDRQASMPTKFDQDVGLEKLGVNQREARFPVSDPVGGDAVAHDEGAG